MVAIRRVHRGVREFLADVQVRSPHGVEAGSLVIPVVGDDFSAVAEEQVCVGERLDFPMTAASGSIENPEAQRDRDGKGRAASDKRSSRHAQDKPTVRLGWRVRSRAENQRGRDSGDCGLGGVVESLDRFPEAVTSQGAA